MLQSMRDKTQGLIAGVISALIALTFALWGVQNFLRSGATNEAAKVNGVEITQDQVRIAYEQLKQNQTMRFGQGFSINQTMQTILKKQILDRLIEQEVIFQAESKMKMGVGRGQLLAVVAGMPIFQVNGQFSPERFHRLVSAVFHSEQHFLSDMERSLLRIQLERGIVDSSFVLPNELATIKKIFKQRRNFGYFVVSPDRFLKDIKISSEDINKYHEEHRSEFLLPEKVSIQYLELISNDFKSKVNPSKEQLMEFYQTNINSFSIPKKWQVTKIILPLSAKATAKDVEIAKNKIDKIAVDAQSSKDLAKLFPELKLSTSWVARNEMSQEIADYLEKLKIGQVSSPFRTQEGYALMKVLTIQPAKPKPYAAVADKVKQIYERQQLTQAFTDASETLADMVYTNPDNLEPAANLLRIKLKNTELFGKTGGKSSVAANPKVIKAAFSDPVLKQRYNSSLIEVTPGTVVVLRIKEHVPETLQPLEKVKDTIIQKLKSQIAKQKAANFANELLQELRDGKNEGQLSKKYGLIWNKVIDTKYGQGGAAGMLVDAAFVLARPEDKKISAIRVNQSDGYAVLRLDKVYEQSSNKDDKQQTDFIKSLPTKLGQYDYASLINYLMSQAKIKIFDDKKK